MRLEQEFSVRRPPEAVFDYLTDPANLAEWQTAKTLVEPLTEGPPRLGTRVRERTKPPASREFEQIVEFTEFDRPHRVHVHVVEGPHRVDGTWSFAPEGAGTRVHCLLEGEMSGVPHLLEPIMRFFLGRQFAAYHRKLRAAVEAQAAS